ncbi:small gtp binding protein rab8 [Anaeramoeba flamelloides]|uniref:Small gtp binding protein rab8 n=1 Tax=Anaeramoeba flamelloides TaxID=1746091 RepID=A0AAV7ZFG4_9EUKA|nr:small gtp binding protein rab8 [Anaeramoeba flamelloides]
MSSSENEYLDCDNILKLVLVGKSGVGKTNLLSRFCLEFKVKKLKIDDFAVIVQIWDTAGQEKFQAMPPTTYRGSHGIVLTYAINEQDSLYDLERWYKTALQYCPPDVKFFLIGNKSDLKSKREVTFEEGENYAKSLDISFMETSAKSSENVEKAFTDLIHLIFNEQIIKQRQITNNQVQKVLDTSTSVIIQNEKDKENRNQKSGCC